MTDIFQISDILQFLKQKQTDSKIWEMREAFVQ